MTAWLPELVLHHPGRPWTLDATTMGVSPSDLDALPWARAFAEMADLEAGAIANMDEGRQVGHFWLRDAFSAPTVGQAQEIGDTLEAVRGFAADIHAGRVRAEDGSPFTDVVHVGIGGSALGPALLIDALGSGAGLQVHFVDNTDPDGIARIIARVKPRLRTTLVLIVTKSGGTPETRNGQILMREALEQAGFHAPSHLVAITCAGSKLDVEANKENWLRIFPMWDWVGGRFSVTSAVGLLPAELAGIDTAALLDGARMMDAWTRETDWRANPAALLAGCWHVAGKGHGDRAMVVLPYSDRLLLLSRYLQQLVMESLGKRLDRAGNEVFQGLTVYGNKGSTDQHAYVQQLRDGLDDFFVHFLQVLEDGAGSPREVEAGVSTGDFLQGFLLGTRRALAAEGRLSLTLTVPRVDAVVLGGLIALYERAVGLYASLVDLNAYHQPGVEAGKKAARDVLDLARDLRTLLAKGPVGVDAAAETLGAEPIEVFYVLERMLATGRCVRRGDSPGGEYALR